MGKRSKENKKRKRDQPRLPTPSSSDSGLIDAEDLAIAVDVLSTLAAHPEQLSEKCTKDIKRATFELHRVMAEKATLGSSLTSKVSAALQDYRFTDALVYLFEMYARSISPPLGALQRWVRECDATSGGDGSPGDVEALRCLDMILRVANMTRTAETVVSPGTLVRIRDKQSSDIDIWHMIRQGSLYDTPPTTPYPNFRVVHRVPGPMRRPPNLYDSTVYTSSPTAIEYSNSAVPTKHDIPGVPGAFMILDVFSPKECLQIVRAAMAIGFEKDEAAEGSARVKSSILARNFVWLADSTTNSRFYERILPFVPRHAPAGQGGAVRGINARYRVYEYTENQVYRPHIDGAWPAAGLDPSTGAYLHE